MNNLIAHYWWWKYFSIHYMTLFNMVVKISSDIKSLILNEYHCSIFKANHVADTNSELCMYGLLTFMILLMAQPQSVRHLILIFCILSRLKNRLDIWQLKYINVVLSVHRINAFQVNVYLVVLICLAFYYYVCILSKYRPSCVFLVLSSSKT